MKFQDFMNQMTDAAKENARIANDMREAEQIISRQNDILAKINQGKTFYDNAVKANNDLHYSSKFQNSPSSKLGLPSATQNPFVEIIGDNWTQAQKDNYYYLLSTDAAQAKQFAREVNAYGKTRSVLANPITEGQARMEVLVKEIADLELKKKAQKKNVNYSGLSGVNYGSETGFKSAEDYDTKIKQLKAEYDLLKKGEATNLAKQNIKNYGSEEYKQTANLGYDKFLKDELAARKESENTPLWLKGFITAAETASDSPIATSINVAQKAYRDDRSYMLPNENWTQEQKDIFGFYYNTNKQKAFSYAMDVNDAINLNKQQEQQAELSTKVTKSGWSETGHSLLSVPANVIGGAAEYLDNIIEGSVRERITTKADLSPQDYAQTVRQAVSDNHEWKVGNYDVFDFVYNTAMSGFDSLFAGLFGGGAGIMLGASAAASTIDDIKARGGNTAQAIIGGTVSGILEGVFEHLSLSQLDSMKGTTAELFTDLFKNGQKGFKVYIRQLGKDIAKSMVVNASEEFSTEVANILYDTLANSSISNYAQLVREYMNNGESEASARAKAAGKLALQALEAGASGALMGLFFGAGETSLAYNAANKAYTGQVGNKFSDFTSELIQSGLESPEGTQSRTLAEKYKKKVDSGKKLTNSEITSLMMANRQQVKSEQGYDEGYDPNEINAAPNISVTAEQKTALSTVPTESIRLVLEHNSGDITFDSLGITDTNVQQQLIDSGVADESGNVDRALLSAELQSRNTTSDASNPLRSTQSVLDSIDTGGVNIPSSANMGGRVKPNITLDGGNVAAGETSSNGDIEILEAPTKSGPLKIKPITAKAQKYVKGIGKSLGRNVEFVNMREFLKSRNIDVSKFDIMPEGAIDKKTGNIYLSFEASRPVQFLLKHELTHFGEKSQHYQTFVKAVRDSKAYLEWLREKTGMQEATRAVMESRLMDLRMEIQPGLKAPGARAEIIADFVGDKLFGESLEDLELLLNEIPTEQRNAIIQFFIDFFEYLKKKFSDRRDITFELSRLEDAFSRMLVDANKNTATDGSGGVKFSTNGAPIIDLSNDNVLSKAVEGVYGSERYTIIQNFILNSLSEQPVTLSDGKKAVVDKRDALHMANKSGQEKATHISAIKQIVETACLVAEEESTKNGKFDYFCYYESIIKLNNKIYPIYLNVGRARNDGKYHIYDITQKLRDTAHRVNDVGRPVGNALKNDISINNIPNSDKNVNNNSKNVYEQTDAVDDNDLQFSFVRATDKELVSEAEQMEKEGKKPVRIWIKTGLIRDASGIWVYEIDDSKAEVFPFGDAKLYLRNPKYKEYVNTANFWHSNNSVYQQLQKNYFFSGGVYGYKLSDFLKHDKLFKKYPELKDWEVRIKELEGSNGECDTDNKVIYLNISLLEQFKRELHPEIENTLFHEVQHAIQSIEERANGTDPKYWEFRLRTGNFPYTKLHKRGYTPYQAYRNTAGEIEANLTGERREMSAKERKNKFPNLKDGKALFVFDNPGVKYSVKTNNAGIKYIDIENKFYIEEKEVYLAKCLYNAVRYAVGYDFSVNNGNAVSAETVSEWKKSDNIRHTLTGRYADNPNELLEKTRNNLAMFSKDAPKNFTEFGRQTVNLKLKDKVYRADIVIGKSKNEELFLYDVLKLRQIYNFDNSSNTKNKQGKGIDVASASVGENISFSLPDNKSYITAVNDNDMQTAQQMADETAEANGYTERLYHQTGADFTEFNTENQKAGKYDYQLPTGTFLKPANDDIGLSGKKQMELYAKIKNPLSFKDREAAQSFWSKNVKGYSEASEAVNAIDEEYGEKFSRAEGDVRRYMLDWRKSNPDAARKDIFNDAEFQRLHDIEQSVLEEWEQRADEASLKAKKLIDKFISQSDYDGVVIERDQGSGGRFTKSYIVFNSNQLKDASPVTYDDDGNVIPLSQRFDETQRDIRYTIPTIDFSNEDIEKNMQELAKMSCVYNVPAERLEKTGKRPSEIFSDFFKSLGNNIYVEKFGDIALSKSSVKSEVRHGITAEKIASIEAIPTVLKYGKIIFAEKKSDSDVYRIVICAPIKIGETPYYMGVMLQRDSQNQRLYLHNVIIEKEMSLSSQADLNTTGALEENEHLSMTNILQKALSVKYNYAQESSKYSNSDSFENIFIKAKKGELSKEEYMKKAEEIYQQKIEENGQIPQGEMVSESNKPFAVPRSVSEGTKVRAFVRTVLESGYATEDQEEYLKSKILTGEFSYIPTSDNANIKNADSIVRKEGYQKAKSNWQRRLSSAWADADTVAKGEVLLKLAFEQKNATDVVNIAADLAELGTRTAQSLQAFSLLKKMGGISQLVYVERCVNKLNKDLEKRFRNNKKNKPFVKIDETLAQQLAESQTEEEYEFTYNALIEDIASQVPATFLDKWNAWRYMAMLANPVTHIRNVTGNAVFFPAVKIKTMLAAATETALSKAGVEFERTKSVVVKKEYRDYAKEDFEKVSDIIAGSGKYNPSDNIDANRRIFKSKVLEGARKLNFDLLEKEDMLFLRSHYTSALGGYLQAQKIDLNNVSEKTLIKAREYAMQEALKATYRDASTLANAMSQLSKIGWFANLTVEGTLPFKKTPINIAKRGVDYSPIGLLTTTIKGVKQLHREEVNVSQMIDGFASAFTGTGICLLGVFLAKLGIVVGGFDDEEKVIEKLSGRQEYSIEIGGISYTVDWMTPSSISFFIGVAIAEYKADEDADILSMIFDFGMAGFEPMLSLSLLSGIENILSSIKYAHDNKSVPAFFGKITESYFSQALPTIFGKVANALDDTEREWSTYIDKTSNIPEAVQKVIDKIASKTPFVSKTRAEYIDAWGETKYTGNFIQRFFQQFVSPGYASTVNVTEVETELKRLRQVTGEAGLYPSVPDKYFKIRGNRRDLSKEEYHDYAIFKGQTQADLVNEAISSNEYAKLTDEQKVKVIKDIYSYASALAKCQLEYSYDEISAMVGEDTKGNLILTEEKYNRLNDKARQILVDEYFTEAYKIVKAYKYAKNGKSVVEYFIEKSKED